MNETKLNYQSSYDIISEIIKCLKQIEVQINFARDEIEDLSKKQTWSCPSSVAFSNRSLTSIQKFFEENKKTEVLIKKLFDKIGTYENVDKKIVESLYGGLEL